MDNQQSFFLGLATGALLMYLLDPDRGARRRSLIRDQVVHGAHELEDLGEAAGSRARHLRNRAYGAVAEGRARLRREEVDDTVLEARVRSGMGRLVSNPGAIEATAKSGRVTLRGVVGRDEVDGLVAGIADIPGVREVVNRLEAPSIPGSAPDLEGSAAEGGT